MNHITFIVQLMEYNYQENTFNIDFKIFVFYKDQMMELFNMLMKIDPFRPIKENNTRNNGNLAAGLSQSAVSENVDEGESISLGKSLFEDILQII